MFWDPQIWQAHVLQWMQGLFPPWGNSAAISLSWVGNYPTYIWIVSLFIWVMGSAWGMELGLTAVLGMVLTDAVKSWFAVPRPIGFPGVRSLYTESAGGASFPSGHALVATAFWGKVAQAGQWIGWARFLRALWVLPVFIGLSRLYLGVHWPLDVLGGWGLGGGLFALLIWMSRTHADRQAKIGGVARGYLDLLWGLIVLGLVTLPLLPDTLMMVRYVAALAVMRLLIGHAVPASTWRIAMLRVVAGGAGMLGLEHLLGTEIGQMVWFPLLSGVWTASVCQFIS